MYREKDYNKNLKGQNGGKDYARKGKKPQVTAGDSVFSAGQAAPQKQSRTTSAPQAGDYSRYYRKQKQSAAEACNSYNNYDDDNALDFSETEVYGKNKKNGKKAADFDRKRKKADKKQKRKRKHPILKVVMILLLALFALTWLYLTLVLDTRDFPKDDAALGITVDSVFGVKNIAFFGVDARDDSDTGRSDAMMIMSFNFFEGKVKMISLLRDTKVPIEGHGETKLNHAYAYGGPVLAVKTINQNFHTDIKEYATVNFNQLSAIVDAVGGVTVDLTETELRELNAMLANGELKGEPVPAAGAVVLNGTQAINYSRIRHIDSDNARTDRQQEILSGILVSVQNMSVTDYPRFARDFAAIAETSLSALDVMALMPNALRGFEIERYTVPDAEYETDLRGGKDSDGLWYWHYDLENAAQRIHTILYDRAR